MKIVNEKGKLFGIINVVDLVILLAVVVVVGAIIWQVFGNRVTDAVSKQEEVTIVVFHRWFTPGSGGGSAASGFGWRADR